MQNNNQNQNAFTNLVNLKDPLVNYTRINSGACNSQLNIS